MQKSNEDCFYFLTSSCSKGAACLYRHSPLALASNVVCPAWLRADCRDPACPMRHTNSSKRPSTNHGILCFFENTPMGCLKLDCPFLHNRPRIIHQKASAPVSSPKTNTISTETGKPSAANNNPLSSVVNNLLLKDNETAVIKHVNDSISNETQSDAPNQIENVKMAAGTQSVTESNRTSTQISNRIVINSVLVKKIEEPTVKSSDMILPVLSSIRTPAPTRVVVSSNGSDSSVLKLKKRAQESDNFTEQENCRKKSKLLSPIKTNEIATVKTSREIHGSLLCGTNKIKSTSVVTAQTKINAKGTRIQKANGHRVVSTTEKIHEGTHLSIEDARRKSRLVRFNKGSQSTPVLASSTQVSLPNGSTVSEADASILKHTVHSNLFKTGDMGTANEVSLELLESGNSSISIPIIHSYSSDQAKKVSTLWSPKTIADQLPKSCPVKLKRSSSFFDSTMKSELSANGLKETSLPFSTDSSCTIVDVSDLSMEKQDGYNGKNHTNDDDSDEIDPFILIDEALLEADRILAMI